MAFEFRSNNVRKINLIAKKNISFGLLETVARLLIKRRQFRRVPLSGQKKKPHPLRQGMTENEP